MATFILQIDIDDEVAERESNGMTAVLLGALRHSNLVRFVKAWDANSVIGEEMVPADLTGLAWNFDCMKRRTITESSFPDLELAVA